MAKFQKGQSGNPGGRRKQDPDIRELARRKARLAFKTLISIMTNEDAPFSSRTSAAIVIIERAYGKPVAPVAVDAEVRHVAQDLAHIPEFERGRRLAFVLSQGLRAQDKLIAEADNVVPLQPKQDAHDAA